MARLQLLILSSLLLLTLSAATDDFFPAAVARPATYNPGNRATNALIDALEDDYSAFLFFFKRAGLDKEFPDLLCKYTVTIFAPTNDAFKSLESDLKKKVKEDKLLLRELMLLHVVKGKKTYARLLEQEQGHQYESPAARGQAKLVKRSEADDEPFIISAKQGKNVASIVDEDVFVSKYASVQGVDEVILPRKLQKPRKFETLVDSRTLPRATRQVPRLVVTAAVAADRLGLDVDEEARSEVRRRQARLLWNVDGTERGAKADSERRGEIEEAVVDLERLGGTPLASGLDQLDGWWELKYSTAADVTGILMAPSSFPLPILQVGRIFQRYICARRTDGGTVQNVVRWSLPGLQDKEGASLIVTAEFDVRSGRAIQLQFERAAVGGVKINDQLQALLAPAALPRTQLSLDALQFFRSLELSVPLGSPLRTTTEVLSSSVPANRFMITFLDERILSRSAMDSVISMASTSASLTSQTAIGLKNKLATSGFSGGLRSAPLRFSPSHGHRFSKRAGRSSLASRAVFDPLHLDAAISTLTSHNFLYAVADAPDAAASAAADVSTAVAAVAADAAASGGDAAVEAAASDGGWFAGLANLLESILKVLEQGLAALNVPYAYGFSIILLTLLVKVVTFPLTKQQVESTMAMQNLAPKVKAIQTKYAGDQERIQLETSRLYKQAGVNPLAGCLPTLATLPVFIGLYQALSNVAKEGVLTEGFFWIPSLAGPTSIAARDSGSGISWLFPFIDGAPPLGWEATAAYLVLPVLLVASQFYAMQIMQPPQSDFYAMQIMQPPQSDFYAMQIMQPPQSDDPAQKNTQAILKFLPLMIGWFSLSVPSGLSLYWFTNNLLSTGQTIYLRKMGGATPKVAAGGGDIIDVGQAKRSAASAVATEQDKEKLRGEQFRKQKEADAARRAAKRAAEEAARAAEEKAAREKARLEQLRAEISGEGEEEVVVVEAEVVPVAGQNGAAAEEPKPVVPATPKAAVAPSSGTPKRSRRSRRTRKATPQ
ncbi:unnamed protein product [Closterium sp. Yama58-4]|nr:unnamed protein product [Closterium sp. Yama58-4]